MRLLMDDYAALGKLLNLIDNGDGGWGDDSDSDLDNVVLPDTIAAAIADIAALQPPVVEVPEPQKVEIYAYDPTENVLDPNVRERFKTENIFDETDLFTRPMSTTNTMEGFMSNVSFHEKDFIDDLEPTEYVVVTRCNYGKSVYDRYDEPAALKKTNRGRKKRVKQKKPRKKQGAGTDFNSQISFISVPPRIADMYEDVIPSSTKVYKFKIFRTGKLQLPGARQENIEDVVACAKKIAEMLNYHLHTFEQNPARLTNVININPVMKNYKFSLKLPRGYLIDLELLRELLAKDWLAQLAMRPEEKLGAPTIFIVKYTMQETKLSITFDTPILGKPNKKTRINIFVRGKINILGAFKAEATTKIVSYLHDIFMANPALIAEEYIVPETTVWEQNIEDPPEYSQPDYWMELMPKLHESDYEEILNVGGEVYSNYMNHALRFVDELC